MKVFYNKGKSSIVLMVILAMLLQIVGPVVGDYVYALGEEEGFRVVKESPVEDGKVIIDWEFTLDPNNSKNSYGYNSNFTLEGGKDPQSLIGEDENGNKVEIGRYEISEDGKITVDIHKELYEVFEEVLEVEEEETVPLTPLVPAEPEITDDNITETTDDEDDLNETGEEGTGDETSTETEINEEGKIEEEKIEGETEEDSAMIINNLLGLFSRNVVYADGTGEEVESYIFRGSFEVKGVEPIMLAPAQVLAGESFNLTVDPLLITKVTAKKGNDELKDIANYRPTMGEKIDLFFDFKLDTDHNYGYGSKLTFPLPNPLKPASGSGVLAKDGEEYAEYKIEGDKVVIIFNKNIRFYGVGGSEGLETIGDFKIEAEYFAHGSNTGLEQELKLPGNDDITLIFKPKEGKVIEDKAVNAESNGQNSQYVEWTVNVNTEMEDLSSGKEFKDTLTGNHKYDEVPGSYSIERYEVDAAGNKGAKTSSGLTPSFASDGKSFTLDLTGKYAYEIKYKTIPGDTEEQNQRLDNKAEFGGVPKSKGTTITYGAPLTKEVSKNGEKANWTITVNKNRRTITSGTTITDTWLINPDKHKLVGGDNASSFTVDGLTPSEYEITDIDEGFKLTLKENVNKEFTIRYSTEPKDLVTGNISLTNNVVRSDRQTDIKPATASYNQDVLTKSNSELNYQNKTVKWTINLNSAGYTMPIGTVITDDFVNKNLKIKAGTFSISGSGMTLDDFTFADKDGEITGDKKGGFMLTSTKVITGPITITYVTDYDVRSVDNLGDYKNKVGVKWDQNYEVSGIESKVTINNQQKAKGYKTGSYNYENKEFNWAVGINYNFDSIDDAVFTDTLPATQVVNKDDVKVYKLDLSGGGDGVQGDLFTKWELVNSSENVLKIKFDDPIDEPYRIVYKSTDKDDYYAPKNPSVHTTENHKIENKAILEGTGYATANWEKEVEVKHSNKLITKKHDTSKYSGSAKLAWEMNLNWSQSKLSDVRIVDEIGLDQEDNPNQKIYEDSFKIYEMNFSGVNSNPSKGTEHKPGEGLYDVKFNPDGSTFEIVFNGTIDKAYRVEYESYFLGASPNELKNIAKLSYTTSTSDESSDQDHFLNAKFTFSGSASNKKGLLEITKVDKDDPNIKLPGAVFELYSASTGGFLIEKVSEDTDGVYKFKTKVGQTKYYLIETEAPEGYSLDASIYKARQEVNINADVTPITIENTKIVQGVELTKIDENNPLEKLTGAEFTLHNVSDNSRVVKDKDGNDYPEIFTTINGKIIVENLSGGNYYFKEIKAPENYVLPTDVKTENFAITDGQIEIKKISKTNKQGKGSITITKADAEDNNIKLEGAEFKLTDTDGTEYTGTTDSSGIFKFESLPYGAYTLVETKSSDGYTLVSKPQGIVLDGDIDNIEKLKTVTNTKKISITGMKEWIGGPTEKPTIWFKLYRNINNEEPVEVEGEDIKKLDDGTIEVEWDNLDKVDEDGKEYIYSIKEVNQDGGDLEPTNYKKAENRLTVINSYVSPTGGSAKAVKEWIKGPANRPTIWFKLYRHIEGGEKEEVPSEEAKIKELENGITEVVWTELTKTDNNGEEYIFSVKEVDKDGNDFEPTNYNKVENLLRVTNTYVIPKIDVTGIKEWIGGSSNRPTIELQLYRDGIKLGESVELKDGETKYTWIDLDGTDIDGKEYKYTIDEVSVPRNYGKSISDDGLTITNRYHPSYYPPTGGGGGGGGGPTRPTDPTNPPTDPTVPVNPPTDLIDPTDPPVDIQEVPKPGDPENPIKEETPKDTPKEGEIEVPEGSEPKVNNPPTNGTVTIDENGKWTYTPNPGFVGKDSFTITITHPDGTEEEIFVEIDVDDPALGIVEPGTVDSGTGSEEAEETLPKTGDMGRLGFYISGLLFIILGIFLTRKRTE